MIVGGLVRLYAAQSHHDLDGTPSRTGRHRHPSLSTVIPSGAPAEAGNSANTSARTAPVAHPRGAAPSCSGRPGRRGHVAPAGPGPARRPPPRNLGVPLTFAEFADPGLPSADNPRKTQVRARKDTDYSPMFAGEGRPAASRPRCRPDNPSRGGRRTSWSSTEPSSN